MAQNVLGSELIHCCTDPVTGFFRNGKCDTSGEDVGMHTVCAEMTEEFLSFSKSQGNDLSTPHPEFGFPGLNPGDHWCICMERWIEAYQSGLAPKINLNATHISVVEYVDLEVLRKYSFPQD